MVLDLTIWFPSFPQLVEDAVACVRELCAAASGGATGRRLRLRLCVPQSFKTGSLRITPDELFRYDESSLESLLMQVFQKKDLGNRGAAAFGQSENHIHLFDVFGFPDPYALLKSFSRVLRGSQIDDRIVFLAPFIIDSAEYKDAFSESNQTFGSFKELCLFYARHGVLIETHPPIELVSSLLHADRLSSESVSLQLPSLFPFTFLSREFVNDSLFFADKDQILKALSKGFSCSTESDKPKILSIEPAIQVKPRGKVIRCSATFFKGLLKRKYRLRNESAGELMRLFIYANTPFVMGSHFESAVDARVRAHLFGDPALSQSVTPA